VKEPFYRAALGNMHDKVTIYAADEGRLTIVSALRSAATDLRASAPLIWRLFVRDFTAQFRQRLFGYFWIVLSPILAIAGYWFMAATGFLRPGAIGLPYVLFLFIGTSIWGLLITTMTTINGSILANGDLLMRTSVSPIALALSGLANIVYSILINTVVLMLLLVLVGFAPSPFVVLYPFLMLPIVVMATGFGLVLASIGVIARDVTTLVISGVSMLMFVTPVIYDAQFTHWLLALIVTCNPLTYLVSFPRTATMLGQFENLSGYLLASAFAVVCLVLGIYCFYLIKDRMIERL
jgi:ABC-type polysaccharide/polyol phosphate export permease